MARCPLLCPYFRPALPKVLDGCCPHQSTCYESMSFLFCWGGDTAKAKILTCWWLPWKAKSFDRKPNDSRLWTKTQSLKLRMWFSAIGINGRLFCPRKQTFSPQWEKLRFYLLQTQAATAAQCFELWAAIWTSCDPILVLSKRQTFPGPNLWLR